MGGDHLAIEEEGNVGVEFLLQFMEPLVGAVPWPRLAHRQNHFATFPIDPEEINHGCVRHAGRRYIGLALVLDSHRRKRPTSNPPSQATAGRRRMAETSAN